MEHVLSTSFIIFILFALRCLDCKHKWKWMVDTLQVFCVWVLALVAYNACEFVLGFPIFLDVFFWTLWIFTKGAVTIELYVTVILFALGPTTITAIKKLSQLCGM